MRYAAFASIVWSILVAGSAAWNTNNLQDDAVYLATAEARANWNKDHALRFWATQHGGVYVSPDERTPPNPYLEHVPDRDVVTTDGKPLTLMNPAYMMRQLSQEYAHLYGIKGKITGQILLNPDNAPDAWELAALKQFDRGVQEALEQSTIDGSPYMRMMRPMVMEPGCMKCHGHLGFKVGDIRGGVSVSVPLSPYLEATAKSQNAMLSTHVGVWLLGVGMIGYLTWRGRRREQERKESRQALYESETRYRKLVENAPEVVYSYSLEKGGVYYSPRVFDVLGYTPEHLYEHPRLWHDSIHPDDLPKVNHAIEQAQQGQSFDIEYRIRNADGNLRWIQDRNIIVQGASDTTNIEGLASDITERKVTERALHDSECKFRAIHESSNVTAIVSIDEHGNLALWNPGAARMFGYSEEEIIGQPLSQLIPERYRDAHVHGLARAISTGNYKVIGKTVELHGLHRHGHEFPLELSLGAWKAEDRTYFSAIINDTTERTAYEDGLRQAKEDAEFANAAKTEFLANMSHELRTPLNGIIGFSELMSGQLLGPLSEVYLGYATDIRNSGLHLLELITEILDTSKLESGLLTLNESELYIQELNAPCMRLMQHKASEAEVAVEIDIAGDLPAILADETRIKQILLNLVSNGLKFTPPGGKVLVHASLAEDGALELEVTDTGRGISEGDIAKVLEPFRQVESIMSRSHEGSGLGLAISKQLAELHGGTLTIVSELGAGTTVTVRIPPERVLNTVEA